MKGRYKKWKRSISEAVSYIGEYTDVCRIDYTDLKHKPIKGKRFRFLMHKLGWEDPFWMVPSKMSEAVADVTGGPAWMVCPLINVRPLFRDDSKYSIGVEPISSVSCTLAYRVVRE